MRIPLDGNIVRTTGLLGVREHRPLPLPPDADQVLQEKLLYVADPKALHHVLLKASVDLEVVMRLAVY